MLKIQFPKQLYRRSVVIFFYCLLIITFSINSRATPTIKIGLDFWPGYYPAVIADEKGFFEENEVAVDIYAHPDTPHMLEMLKNGELDAICTSAGDIIPLFAESNNYKIVLIADISSGGDALISFSRLNINSKKLRIGLEKGSFSELFVNEFLIDYRIDKKQVELINISHTETKEAILKKNIDLFHTWEPSLSKSLEDGAKVIYTSRQTPGLIPDVVTFRQDFLENNPQAAKRFINAWFQGQEWWSQNLQKGNQIIKERLILKKPINIKYIKIMNREDNIQSFSGLPPRSIPKVVQIYADFFYNNQTLNQRLDAKNILDSKYIEP